MKIFVSKIAQGFFNDEWHGAGMPPDAVEISVEEYLALRQGSSQPGKELDWSGAKPFVVDRPAPTAEEILKRLTGAVQRYIDSIPREWGYDDAASAISYAEEPAVPQFQAEGRAIRAWRSLVWAAAAQVRDGVIGGQIEPPTASALLELLPAPPARPF